ncbi:MAG: hypothetical protein JXQ93_09890 [Flavobacteriaceae bacterium]
MQLTDTQKINWVRIIAILSVLVLMMYAPNLWISSKDIPVIPLFDWIPIPTGFLDYFFWWFFFISQCIYIFYNKRWLGSIVFLLYLYLAFVDQNRLQPYFYQSFLTILAIIIFPKKTKAKKVLYTVILIFFATYFWSGIQKLNDSFYIQWLSALEKHFNFLPQWFLVGFTYAVPWLEASMGVMLLFNKTRKFSIGFIIGMHAIITFLLFYLGYGYNVVPWNIQNIISVIILFWGLKTIHFYDFFITFFNKQKAFVLFITCLLPLGNNLFGIYDKLLSFHFFTADLKYYNVFISEELEDKLPKHIQQYYRIQNGETYIQMNEWAGDVNKVLFYPEDRIINYANEYLKSFADDPTKEDLTKLVVYNQIKAKE